MKKFENILVAFDLNKTLFFKSDSPLPRMHDKKIKKLFFYIRPHLKELIEYLHSNQVNYCFWSNMLGRNCVKYVKQLQSLGMNKHCGIFDQDFCDKPQNMAELGQKVNFIKNLNKLAQLFNIDVDNCILVDDSKFKNVEGCNLIHVGPYQGQQNDKQILQVIERLKQFRKTRVNVVEKIFPMLNYRKYTFKPQEQAPAPKQKVQKKEQPHQLTQIEILIENNPQLKKMKADLTTQKQIRKNVISQIQSIQKSNAQMAEQIKKQSEGKVVRKGDQLIVQVLLFAKNKKAAEKKLEELQQKKKLSEQKISIIKKLMRGIIQKLNPNADQAKQDQTKDETPEELCSDAKKKKSKKSKKTAKPLQGQKQDIEPIQVSQAKQQKK